MPLSGTLGVGGGLPLQPFSPRRYRWDQGRSFGIDLLQTGIRRVMMVNPSIIPASFSWLGMVRRTQSASGAIQVTPTVGGDS